ncbi:MAG: transposase IS4 family protein [Candidatus Scalindua rubra]|uniref:Transposase IS4 family protein n=1 Tax=Candidatus Scalindua rubra TaxID=1872076 RepID=A0A1E3X2H3_9BACT|nr:MAG: transposase IS4 family protein [Candidatus Scalindua rubra]
MNNTNNDIRSNELKENNIKKLSILRSFKPLLKRLHSHADCHNRKLHYDQYISLILLYFFNPTLTGLRSIQRASTLKSVQSKLGIKRTSLGSMSEASHVFDPQLLTPIISELIQDANPLKFDNRFNKLKMTLVAVDGTLLKALPKMLWALWLDNDHRAAKMHLEFDLLKGIPLKAQVTEANASETTQLESTLSPGKLYCLDAGYREYRLLDKIIRKKSSFVVRLQDNASYKIIEEHQLSDADRKTGVDFDRTVWLGSKQKRNTISKPIRIIQIHYYDERVLCGYKRKSRVSSKKTFRTRSPEHTLLIATDLMDLPAELISIIYRYRWEIEIFFRWFKCILGCRHLLAISRNGLTIQVYCALIVSLLIRLWTGRKPTKHTFEMICLYFQGWATLEELIEHIEGLKPDNQKQQ